MHAQSVPRHRQTGPVPARRPTTLPRFAALVLEVVDLVPPGKVLTYGDVAEYLGEGGPRQVGAVMSRYGGHGALVAGAARRRDARPRRSPTAALAAYRARGDAAAAGRRPGGPATRPLGRRRDAAALSARCDGLERVTATPRSAPAGPRVRLRRERLVARAAAGAGRRAAPCGAATGRAPAHVLGGPGIGQDHGGRRGGRRAGGAGRPRPGPGAGAGADPVGRGPAARAGHRPPGPHGARAAGAARRSPSRSACCGSPRPPSATRRRGCSPARSRTSSCATCSPGTRPGDGARGPLARRPAARPWAPAGSAASCATC